MFGNWSGFHLFSPFFYKVPIMILGSGVFFSFGGEFSHARIIFYKR
jgi:hypothetical protein